MPEVQLPAPVKAKHFIDLPEKDAPPGSFTYYVHSDSDEPRGMIYVCPCGCGRQGSLAFRPLSAEDVAKNRASWDWNGNVKIPTLNPSVHHVGHWHGWLRAGQWQQA
jgi:hypothetical protein